MATHPLVRFWRHVKQDGDCLIWTGNAVGRRRNYGQFRATTNAKDPKVYAHRWIYEQTVAVIPDGYEIDHLCRRGLCVNVAHMEVVTHRENMARARAEKCRNGHDLTDPANCRWDSRGHRRGCAVCSREQALRRYYELRDEEARHRM